MTTELPPDFSEEADTDRIDMVQLLLTTSNATLKRDGLRLIRLLHKYARENLLLANIYIKDPAVTMIRRSASLLISGLLLNFHLCFPYFFRDQKIPVIWFVANVGGILGLCMGCSLVTVFEVLHHIVLIFLRTSVKSVTKIHRTIRANPEASSDVRSGVTMAALLQMGSNMNLFSLAGSEVGPGGIAMLPGGSGVPLTPARAAILIQDAREKASSMTQVPHSASAASERSGSMSGTASVSASGKANNKKRTVLHRGSSVDSQRSCKSVKSITTNSVNSNLCSSSANTPTPSASEAKKSSVGSVFNFDDYAEDAGPTLRRSRSRRRRSSASSH